LLEKRIQALWQEPEVMSVMRQWWALVTTNVEISHGEYSKCSNGLLRRLLPDVDYARLEAITSENWQSDGAGEGGTLSFNRFSQVVFELADLWSAGASLVEKVAFFQCLLQSASHEIKSGGDGVVHFIMLRSLRTVLRPNP